MQRALIGAAILFLLIMPPLAHADYSSTAYGGHNDTTFNRITDWFATVGKPQESKYIILKKRRAARKIARAKRRIDRQKKAFIRNKSNSQ